MSGIIAPTAISIASMIVPALSVIAGVWLSSKLGKSAAKADKIWQRKAQAYSTILAALHEMEHWYDVHLDESYRGYDAPEEVQVTRQKAYQGARATLRAAIGENIWLLSDEVDKRVKLMDRHADDHDQTWQCMLDSGSAATRSAINDLSSLARRELRD